jgi:hypothetical protein
MMYWVVNNNPAIEQMSINGTDGMKVTLLTEPTSKYTGITLLSDTLYISDSVRRNILKFNLSTGQLTVQPPPAFSNISDVKFLTATSAPLTTTSLRPSTRLAASPIYIIYSCVFRIKNWRYTSSLSDRRSKDYIEYYQTLSTVLKEAFSETLDAMFIDILNMSFSAGSVVVSNIVQLTDHPTDDIINSTNIALQNQLALNNITADGFTFLPAAQTTTLTPYFDSSNTAIFSTPRPDPVQSEPGSSSGSNLALIIGIVVGVGGLIIIVIIIIVCAVVCALVIKYKRPSVAKSEVEEFPDDASTYAGIDLVDVPPYERLQKLNDYAGRDEDIAPPALPYRPGTDGVAGNNFYDKVVTTVDSDVNIYDKSVTDTVSSSNNNNGTGQKSLPNEYHIESHVNDYHEPCPDYLEIDA